MVPGWLPEGEIDVREWIRVGSRFGTVTRCSQWWLGDWIRYGHARWGERYKEASRITGYDIQSLRNIAYVAGRIDLSRRRDDLTWSHHAEVCALSPEEQDRWLAFAARERLSVADLRIELRGTTRRSDPEGEMQKAQATVIACPNCEHQFEIGEG